METPAAVELKKLDSSFYTDNPEVHEALDFDIQTKTWASSKVRGHGVVTIAINGLTFAIPVRSNIRHKASFILEVNRNRRDVKGMGLDYSKALLIRSSHHVSNDVFLLKNKASGKKLVDKKQHITHQFTKYVGKYIAAVQRSDERILSTMEYKYSTLRNYHDELGLS